MSLLQLEYVLVGSGDDTPRFLVDEALGLTREDLAAGDQRCVVVAGDRYERPYQLGHSPAADHLSGDRGHLLEIRLGARGVVAVDERLGRTAG